MACLLFSINMAYEHWTCEVNCCLQFNTVVSSCKAIVTISTFLYFSCVNLRARMASKVPGGAVTFERTSFSEQSRLLGPSSKCRVGSNPISQKIELSKSYVHISNSRVCSSFEGSWLISRQPCSSMISRKHPVLCYSMGTQSSEAKEHRRNSKDSANLPGFVSSYYNCWICIILVFSPTRAKWIKRDHVSCTIH